MLNFFVTAHEPVQRLRTDEPGVVSFKYVIIAACIVAAVAAAFGTGTASEIGQVLNPAMTAIFTVVPAV